MITRIFLESYWLLIIVWVVVQFVLVCVWSLWRARASSWMVGVGLLMLPILLVVSRLVVTSGEQIRSLCYELAAAVEAGDLAALRVRLSPGLEVTSLSRDKLIDRIESAITRHSVREPRLSRFALEDVTRNKGVVLFSASARVDSREVGLLTLATRWRLTCRRSEESGGSDSWQVTRIELIPTPPLNIRSVDDLLRR